MTEPVKKDKPRCPDIQVNRGATPDFDCKLEAGSHNVHIDTATGLRWGHRGHRRPHPKCRKY